MSNINQNSTEPKSRSLGVWIRDRFLAGLFVVAPMALVIWLAQLLYHIVNGPADVLIRAFIREHWLPGSEYFTEHTNGTIPGAGLVLTLILIFSVGISLGNFLGQQLVRLIDRFFSSVPFINTIYQSLQQVVAAVQKFSDSDSTQKFSKVVLIPFAPGGSQCLGFLTSQFTNPQGEKMATVFVPTPPSPFNGLLFIVPLEKVVPADYISVEEATKMIITMGLVAPNSSDKTPSA